LHSPLPGVAVVELKVRVGLGEIERLRVERATDLAEHVLVLLVLLVLLVGRMGERL
jgi:hypothetical protein